MCITPTAFETSRIPQSRGVNFVSCALFRPTTLQERNFDATCFHRDCGHSSTPIHVGVRFWFWEVATHCDSNVPKKNIATTNSTRTFLASLFDREKQNGSSSTREHHLGLKQQSNSSPRLLVSSLSLTKNRQSLSYKLSILRFFSSKRIFDKTGLQEYNFASSV